MNSKSLTISTLLITALILLIAQFMPITPIASADTTIKDRDYSLSTAISAAGGDIIYVIDNRTGLMAAFAWDSASRSLQPRAGYSLADAFR
jgi:hypothetical protein